MINLTLPYPPTVNHYWMTSGKMRYISKRGKAYIDEVSLIARSQKANKNLANRLSIHANVHCPDRRVRDLDNILKALFDSLTKAKVIQDDNLIDLIHVERKEVIKGGKVIIRIKELNSGK